VNDYGFLGKNGFFWFVGVVEDRHDPEKLGRVRVRIIGWHNQNKTEIPTCELFWAYVHSGINSAAISGLGMSPTGLVEGTHVFGFFRDGASGQDPVITNTVSGVPQEASNPGLGFNDPGKPFHKENAPRKIYYRHYPNDGSGAKLKYEKTPKLYPRESHPWGCELNEPDTNRLARGEKLEDTVLGVDNRQRAVSIPIAPVHTDPERSWNQPKSPAAPEYPYNHVMETESGHIVEFDDTFGNERIKIRHNTGSMIEFLGNPDQQGDFIIKIVGKSYSVVAEQAYSQFQNNLNVTVQGETNIYCQSDANVQVDGNLKLDVGGNFETRVHGDIITDVDGDYRIRIGGNESINVNGNAEKIVRGNSDYHAQGVQTFISGSSMNISSGGAQKVTAGGTYSVDAPEIHLNSGYGSTIPPRNAVSQQVPPFPPSKGFRETISETGNEPEPEEKPDPDWKIVDQKICD